MHNDYNAIIADKSSNKSTAQVAVMLLSFNHEAYVLECLHSIKKQSTWPAELIVCDDGSGDATVSIIESFVAADNLPGVNVKLLFSSSNKGLMTNFCSGLVEVSAEWVIVGSCDDVFEADRIEVVQRAVERNCTAKCIYSNATVIDRNGSELGVYYKADRLLLTGDLLQMASRGKGVLGATAAYHKDVWSVFTCPSKSIVQEDLIFPFRAAILGDVVYLTSRLVRYRMHEANVHFGDVRKLGFREIVARARRTARRRYEADVQRMNDLDEASNSDLIERRNYLIVRDALANHLEVCSLECDLEQMNWTSRILCLCRALCAGKIRPGKFFTLLSLYCFPFAYVLMQRVFSWLRDIRRG